MRVTLLLLSAWMLCESQRLRLQGSKKPCTGRVEVLYNGSWGIVCSQKWSENNDQVICNMLRCGIPVTYTQGYSYPDVPDTMWMNNVKCSGNETNLWNCRFPGWGISACSHNSDHANVECSENIVLNLTNKCAGAVQITNSNGTGRVCHDHNWDENAANVVCRQLGCGEADRTPQAGIFSAEGLTTMMSVKCTGDEQHLWKCEKTIKENCSSAAGVICSNHTHLRLSDGEHLCAGRLEGKVGKTWKPVCNTSYPAVDPDTICRALHCGTSSLHQHLSCNTFQDVSLTCSDNVTLVLLVEEKERHCFGAVHFKRNDKYEAVCANSWDTKDTSVVCRELKCGEGLSFSQTTTEGDGQVDHVDCDGSESSLLHCVARHKPIAKCKKATVICEGSVEVRLTHSIDQCSGIVEVFYGGTWMSVSEHGWTKNHSDLICKNQGCGLSYNHSGKLYMEGEAPVWIKVQGSPENDSSIGRYLTKSNIIVDHNIKVTCEEYRTLHLQGQVPCAGQVAVEYRGNNYWLAASEETWNSQSAAVVCRERQCGYAVSFESRLSREANQMWWKYLYNCSSSKTSLFDCEKVTRANQSAVAYVKCSGSVSVRLEKTCWGQVELCKNVTCGPVCASSWTLDLSKMLCENLGCGKSFPVMDKHSLNSSYRYNSIYCPAETKNITQCNIKLQNNSSCKKAVNVFCSASLKAKLRDLVDHCSGTAEIFHLGQWSPICSDTLKENLPDLICEQAGCGKKKSINPINSSRLGLEEIKCHSEASIEHCEIGHRKNQCNQVNLKCSGWARMLLVGSNDSCEGRVFVVSGESLQPVNVEGWTVTEYQVLCRNLQCGTYIRHKGLKRTLEKWWPKAYTCTGKENKIWDCKTSSRPSITEEQLYIKCSDNRTVEISNGSSCSGTVQMRHNGAIQNICGDGWNLTKSRLVCQELGCGDAFYHITPFSVQHQAYHLDCVGEESNLGQCKSELGYCNSKVSVTCTDSIKVRLSKNCGGVIEICYGHSCEPVCSLGPYSQKEQQMICSELACGNVRNESGSIPNSSVPALNLRNSLQCKGPENFIKYCVRRTGCNSNTFAEVYCEKFTDDPRRGSAGLIVGVILGALLVIMIAAFIFWQARRKKSRKSTRTEQNPSIFESGEYEDVASDDKEMMSMTMHEGEGEAVVCEIEAAPSEDYDNVAPLECEEETAVLQRSLPSQEHSNEGQPGEHE
ncbi:deleted in malignant brain tumors 1 protein [Brienomyrus brachyistius]|uniref:deleted in malignant brain tumors 1 protein n=1 Tax=Brienomyrus brachyistius TaxID=42636 RepID=UPI0020B2FE4E|nr:deleted in malignant brain tumors 1 protein [Brienomyrus brachyistius]